MSILVFEHGLFVRTVRLLKMTKFVTNLWKFWSKFDEILTFLIFVKFLTHLFLNLLIVIWQFLNISKSCSSCQFWKVVKMSKALTRTSSRWTQKLSKMAILMIFLMIFRLALLHVTFWSAFINFGSKISIKFRPFWHSLGSQNLIKKSCFRF